MFEVPIVDYVTELTECFSPQSTRLVAMITIDPGHKWYSLPISRDEESPYSFYYKGETLYIPEDAYREYIKYMGM